MGDARRIRPVLAPLSWIYGAVVSIRNACYDSGIFSVKKINTPVISVGNITTGGTGKTPLVEHLITRLTGRGLRPAVLSRGGGRTQRGTPVARGRAGLVIVNRRREGTPTAGAPGRIVMRHSFKPIVDPATGGDVPFDTL